jgi:predicted amidohydrolase YtcJ
LLVTDDQITWIGPDHLADWPGARTVDLDGALVLPGFVDAHAHVTETGLLLAGVDLSSARSVVDVLDLVAAAATARPGRPVLGHGWDELRLAEGRPPSAAELDRAAPGCEVYLSRVDVHSAVVSGALAERSRLSALPGWDPSGRVERDAHHAVRHATRFEIDPANRRSLQLLALRSAAAAGITELHEMSAPHVAPVQDLVDLVALSSGARGSLPDVVPYRGDLAGSVDEAHRIVADLAEAGLPWVAGLAGDLMVDGSFGSRTAALHDDYADGPGQRGHLYLDTDQIRDHVVACTRAGLQAGFHVIGDAAVHSALAGFEAAAAIVGPAAIRAARHRIEHLEALDGAGAVTAARLGLIASVQPAFDNAWGGTERMYAVRLGPRRAARLNPFATMAAAGVLLAFGSDSPVTPFAPWEGIRAALRHRTPEQRIGIETALHAHTLGGRAAAGPGKITRTDGERAGVLGPPGVSELAGVSDQAGVLGLRVGGPATFTCWHSPDLPSTTATGTAAQPTGPSGPTHLGTSTDLGDAADLAGPSGPSGPSGPRELGDLTGLAGALAAGAPPPFCTMTVIRGRIAFTLSP